MYAVVCNETPFDSACWQGPRSKVYHFRSFQRGWSFQHDFGWQIENETELFISDETLELMNFTMGSRLSPIPSWLNNYALPLSDVPFATFLPATLLGMIPPLMANVCAGEMFLAEQTTSPDLLGWDMSC